MIELTSRNPQCVARLDGVRVFDLPKWERRYSYDALVRLTQTSDGAAGAPIEMYECDATGNRTALKNECWGTNVGVSRYDLCGCKDGRIVIKPVGCKGPIVGETDYRWK